MVSWYTYNASAVAVFVEWWIVTFVDIKNLKRFLSKSEGCRVVKSTTSPQCKLTRNKHGMVTRLTC